MRTALDITEALATMRQSTLTLIADTVGVPTMWQQYKSGKVYHLKNETLRKRLVQFARTGYGPQAALNDAVRKAEAGELKRAGIDRMPPVELPHELIKDTLAAAAKEAAAHAAAYVDEQIEAAADKLRPTVIQVHPKKKGKRVAGVLPKEFDKIVKLASQRVNCLLVGPSGCGKTYVAEKAADALGLRFGAISCSAGMSESQVAGWLLPTGDDGAFTYQPAPFVDFYENGGVFLFDEIDAADPNMMTFINTAIANGHMHIPQRLGNPLLTKHKDFVVMAAANTWGHGADATYVGRNQLDAATLDRFAAGKVFMDYDDGVEDAMADKAVVRWGRSIREKIRAHGLRRIMSTRTMIELSKMTRAYKWGKAQWDETYFADWAPNERAKVVA